MEGTLCSRRYALADAMTVLMGKARKNAPAVDVTLAGLLRRGPKESVSTHLVQLAEQRYRLGISTTGQPYAVPSAGPNVARPLRGGRRSLRAELTKLYFEQTKSAANAQALADALLVLEGKAQAAKPTELALRVAQRGSVEHREDAVVGGEIRPDEGVPFFVTAICELSGDVGDGVG